MTKKTGTNNNPIFVEYYSHTGCDCYKINLPWTKYRRETIVLCTVDNGIKRAKILAKRILSEHIECALSEDLQTKGEQAE